MLTGKLPFSGTTATALALQIVQAPAPVPASTINRAVAVASSTRLSPGRSPRASISATSRRPRWRPSCSRWPPSSTCGRKSASRRARRRSARRSQVAAVPISSGSSRRAAAGRARRGVDRTRRDSAHLAPHAWSGARACDRRHTAGARRHRRFADVFRRRAHRGSDHTARPDAGIESARTLGDARLSRPTPQDVAQELGASVVLTGRPSVGRDGQGVARADRSVGRHRHLVGSYTRDVKDIFAVQAQVAEEVANGVAGEAPAGGLECAHRPRLVDRAGLRVCICAAVRRWRSAACRGDQFYEQAIAADAGLAEAFAGLAEALHGPKACTTTIRQPAAPAADRSGRRSRVSARSRTCLKRISPWAAARRRSAGPSASRARA